MFCPKCGGILDDATNICTNCGFNATQVINDNKFENQQDTKNDVPLISVNTEVWKSQKENKVLFIIYIVLAIVVLSMFFLGAHDMIKAGEEVEEYLTGFGDIYEVYATIIRGLGIYFASVLVWLGINKKG